jgi:hypothetical protein
MDNMSLPGIKQPGAKWFYRGERYTLCGSKVESGVRWFKIYEDTSEDLINEIKEADIDRLFEPAIDIGHVYKYPGYDDEYEVINISTSLVGSDYRLFVKIKEGDKLYDLLYKDMIGLIEDDGLTLVVKIDMDGATCNKCGTFYEYANFAVDFRCWACKNGY